MEILQLTPIHRKSFYGKCHVEKSGMRATLKSYNTVVAQYNYANDVLVLSKDKSHYTQTTLRHIKAFLNFVGLPQMTKKEMLNYYKI